MPSIHANTTTLQESAPTTEPALSLVTDDFVRERGMMVVVEIDGSSYGVSVDQTISVVARGAMTRIPGARRETLGVINVRGRAVTVLDSAAMLNNSSAISTGPIVLLEHGDGVVGFAVDAIRDVRVEQLDADDQSEPHDLTMLDASALCARFLISAEELRR